jgi:hypothetical protein
MHLKPEISEKIYYLKRWRNNSRRRCYSVGDPLSVKTFNQKAYVPKV